MLNAWNAACADLHPVDAALQTAFCQQAVAKANGFKEMGKPLETPQKPHCLCKKASRMHIGFTVDL